MPNKIEKFLQDIHNIKSTDIDKKGLEKKLNLLISANPKIVADDAFKHKLRTRLNNIIDYKAGNEQVKKLGYLKILIPIFASFVFIIGVFSMVNINFSDSKNNFTAPIVPETQTIIDPDLNPIEIAQQINEDEKKEKQKTVKEKILEKARIEKQASQQNIAIEPLSDNIVYGEANAALVENILEDITAGDNVDGAGTQFNNTSESDAPEPLIIDEEAITEYETSSQNTPDESFSKFELFCSDNEGTIIDGEEEQSCSFGEGKICRQTQINNNECKIE